MEEGDKTEQDLIEELVVRCLEHTSELDLEAVTAVCAEHPDQLDRVRERLKSLERLGLLRNLRTDDPEVPGHEILRRLGSGGMAVVYAAREDATRHPRASRAGRGPGHKFYFRAGRGPAQARGAEEEEVQRFQEEEGKALHADQTEEREDKGGGDEEEEEEKSDEG